MKKRGAVRSMVCGIVLLLLGTSVHGFIQTVHSQSTPIVLSKSLSYDSVNNSTEYFAVLCACSQYENRRYNIPRGFPAPPSKLRVLYDALLQTKNWKEDHIILLLNENATRQHMLDALTLMATMVGPEDIFLFTWNGHGSEVPDLDGDEALCDPDDTTDEVICPYDTNKSNGNFTNIITDDELGLYFSAIHAKGKFLIFESCLSGGLVDQKRSKIEKTSLLDSDIVQKNTILETMDVNGTNTIVLMSTLPSTLGRATLKTHSPLLSSVATIVLNGERYDRNDDGMLSAEELFQGARPRMLMQSSLWWMYLWFGEYLFYTFDMYKLFTGISPRLMRIYRSFDKMIPNPFALATCFIFVVYALVQILEMHRTGHYVFNWPSLRDEYPEELPIVQL